MHDPDENERGRRDEKRRDEAERVRDAREERDKPPDERRPEVGPHHAPPDAEGSGLDEDLLLSSPNALAGLDPELAPLAGVVHVVHVPAVRPGRLLQVYLDGEGQVGIGVFA